MKMNIEDHITGKGDHEEVNIEGAPISVLALKNLLAEGYTFLQPYKENNTFSVWGKTCSACFTAEQIRERA
ncbi:MAG: hypothetical protein PVG99_08885 [Desulfobacteraceae bacterium]|jgi:hypothetical protein